jgi:hypothetical protein
VLLGDEGSVRMVIGGSLRFFACYGLIRTEVFVTETQDQATERLEKREQTLNSDIERLSEDVEGILGELAVLKTKLYAKFKNSINLEETSS